MLIFIWSAILGGILLVAFIAAAIGFLCTHSGRNLVPSLLFGLPAVILSLPVFVFCAETSLLFLIPFAAVALFLGLLVIFRGVQTGQKRRDLISGALICIGLILFGFALHQHPKLI
jgi:uncharacterized membrane protein HdeD (DUF308 family)